MPAITPAAERDLTAAERDFLVRTIDVFTRRRLAIAELPPDSFVVGWSFGLFVAAGAKTFVDLEEADRFDDLLTARIAASRYANERNQYATAHKISRVAAELDEKLASATGIYINILAKGRL